jgi:hypothetical protein
LKGKKKTKNLSLGGDVGNYPKIQLLFFFGKILSIGDPAKKRQWNSYKNYIVAIFCGKKKTEIAIFI